jgi:hypothetical protein
MSATLCAAVVAAVLAAGQPAPADTKTATVRRADLDEVTLKGGGVVFNNFQLSEEPPRAPRTPDPEHEAPDVTLRGTYRNGTPRPAEFTLVAVGLDADGEVLWACNIAGAAQARNVGVFLGSAEVPRDTLRQTATIRLRVRLAPPPTPTPPPPPPTGQP